MLSAFKFQKPLDNTFNVKPNDL